jgi:hypothetical protein
MQETDELIPPVSPAYLKTAYEYCSKALAERPGVALSVEHLFPTGTDAYAIGRRCSMLWLVTKAHQLCTENQPETNPFTPLSRYIHGMELDGAMFSVMARIELQNPRKALQGWPCDIEDFMRQVEQEAA